MLRVTPIFGSRRAIDHYAGLIRQSKQEHQWEESRRTGRSNFAHSVSGLALPG
jgi:hypothetical protein